MGDKFGALCDKVWESMDKEARAKYLGYVNVRDINAPSVAEMRAAADEYMAFLAEGVDLTDADRTVWQKIVEFFREFVEKLGVKMSDKDIELLIKASYANLRNTAAANNAQTEDGETRERKVFHGSGAKFDRFDHSFMGTGEGAQAYGWGTYVTEVEGIGKSYAGVGVTKLGPLQAKLGNIDSAISLLEKEVQKAEKDLTSDNETVRRIATYTLETASERRKALEEEKATVEEEMKSYRNLYTVEIPDDNGSNYLHWEEVVPSNVVNAVKQRLFDELAKGDYKGAEKELKRELDNVFEASNNEGYMLYGNISSYLGGDKAASRFLNEMGFVGISYPADGGRAGNKRNYVIFNENDAQIENRTMFRIAEVNKRFNERLLELDKDRTQKDRVLRLGRPSEFLKNAGIIDADIEMEFDKFVKKSSEDYENNHPFTAEDIMDLPKAIYAPIAVFNSTNNRDKVILTELKKDGKNFIVAIKAVERRRKGGVVLEVNEIATLYPKNAKGILSWINNGLIANVDKEKTLDWLEALRTNRGTGLNNQELSDAANVINNFENPSIESENSADTRFRIANRSQEVFVSNARKAVEEIKQDKATPQQWLAMLKKNGGLKAGEDAWMGLGEWLENSGTKSLTKQEVLGFIDENAIKIEEVEYRDDASDNYAGTTGFLRAVEEQLEEDARYHAESEVYPDEFDNEEDYLYAIRSAIREYKEDPTGVHYNIAAEKVVRRGDGPNLINSTRLDYTTEGLENKREIALTVPTIEPYNASDEVHFGDAGNGRAVAWVRFGETTDSEGNRVLVIDEIQSKRHQDGREKGYGRKLTLKEQEELSRLQKETDMRLIISTVADELYKKGFLQTKEDKEKYFYEDAYLIYNGKYDDFASKYGKKAADKLQKFEDEAPEKIARIEQLKAYQDGVPAAPFDKNWHELAMKRMLRLAAEEGFDKVAWTTGEQQAKRYNLGNVIKKISVFPDSEFGGRQVMLRERNNDIIDLDVDNNGVIENGQFKGMQLSEVVGRELAVKILGATTNEEYESNDLRIGGEGMKGFYDRMLPSFVQKYTKKWGAKVGEVTMPNLEQNNTMWSVDITPEMQESVMEGQTMFRKESEAKTAKKDRAAGKRETAPETASVQEEHQPTVVSSADGAKVLKDLDSAIAEYENDVNTKEKTFLGNLAKIVVRQ